MQIGTDIIKIWSSGLLKKFSVVVNSKAVEINLYIMLYKILYYIRYYLRDKNRLVFKIIITYKT